MIPIREKYFIKKKLIISPKFDTHTLIYLVYKYINIHVYI